MNTLLLAPAGTWQCLLPAQGNHPVPAPANAEEGWDPLSLVSLARHLTPEPPSWWPLLFHVIAYAFITPKKFQRGFLDFRASHGTRENGISQLQRGRGLPCFKGMNTGGDGEGEWKNLRVPCSPRDREPGEQLTAVEQRMLDPFSTPVLSIGQGISCIPMGTFPEPCV